jgi:hypothetical protein
MLLLLQPGKKFEVVFRTLVPQLLGTIKVPY